MASGLGVQDGVDFLGEVPPVCVASLLDASTLVIVPSRSEGFGLVALEAAHRGRPVIATRVGGLPEVVVHGETGIVVEPEDPSAIARAVVELLGDHPEAEKMGQCAQRRAARDFGWQGFVGSYERLYRTLIAGDLSASAAAESDRV
jgi:glycosyltransferase involved in cell wall biosynthesis